MRTSQKVAILNSGGVFSPTDVPGFLLWLDAQDISTLFQDNLGTVPVTSDTDPVGYWGDKSESGNQVVQASAGLKPTYVTSGVNSLPSLLYDGGDTLASTVAAFDVSAGLAIFAAVQTGTIDGNFKGIASTVSTGGTGMAITVRNNDKLSSYVQSPNFYLEGPTATSTTDYIVSSTHTGTARKIYVDGVEENSSSHTITDSASVIALGRFFTNGAITWDGYMGEILVYSPVPSDAEIQAIHNYLIGEWL